MNDRIQAQSAEVEVDVPLEAFTVAVAVGPRDECLDDAVNALTIGVGGAVHEVVEDLLQMVPDHPGDLLDGFQLATHGVPLPCLEEHLRRRPVLTLVEGAVDATTSRLAQDPSQGPGKGRVFVKRRWPIL